MNIINKGNLNTPYIKLDLSNGNLTIIGKSYPEEPSAIYNPILMDIKGQAEYLKDTNVTIKIALEIMNSISTKYIFQIIKSLYELCSKIFVRWYCESDDDSMIEEGNNFKSSFPHSDFNIIYVKDLRKI